MVEPAASQKGLELERDVPAEPILVTTDRGEIIVDREAGTITSWAVNGQELLVAGPRFDIYRAPTSNDTRVRVEGFWKIIPSVRPGRRRCSSPALCARFRPKRAFSLARD